MNKNSILKSKIFIQLIIYYDKMKDNYLKFFLLVTMGLILITILYPIILYCFISDSTSRGVFGDSFGALNTFFSALALGGVIVSIFMQRNEMNSQREEMKSSRYEYTHNRITNLVYWQLEKFENSLNLLKIDCHPSVPSGNNAMYFLDKNLKYVRNYKVDKKEKLEEALSQKTEILNNLFVLASSKDEITAFIISVHNCVSALNSIIYKCDLTEEDKKELKSIFLNNVGIVTPHVIETINASVDFLGQFFRELEVDKNQYENISNLFNIFIYIDEVLVFFNKN